MWWFSASRTFAARDRVRQVELRDLGRGVNAGVGAAGDGAGDGRAVVQSGGGGFQHFLNRQPGRLALPADERRTVVFQTGGPSGHGSWRWRLGGGYEPEGTESPPPLAGGGWGEGATLHPGPPTPSRKGRGTFRSCLLPRHRAQHRPGRHRMPAQEHVRRHGRAASQLDPCQPQRAAAAGNGQPLVQHRAGWPRPAAGATASTFRPAPRSVVNVPGQGSNARTCRSIAPRVARPVDPSRIARQLRRVGRAVFGLRHRHRGSSASARRISRAPDLRQHVVQRRRGGRRGRSAPPRAAASARCRARRPSA